MRRDKPPITDGRAWRLVRRAYRVRVESSPHSLISHLKAHRAATGVNLRTAIADTARALRFLFRVAREVTP